MKTYKTFLNAMEMISTEPLKAAQYLQDKRLSLNEKKILNAWVLLRSNKFDQIIETLSTLIVDDSFLNYYRELALGSSFNNKGDLNQALKHLLNSYDLVKDSMYGDQKFTAIKCLFQLHYNLKDQGEVERFFNLLKECPRSSRHDDSFLLCELDYFSIKLDFTEAMRVVEEAERRFSQFSELNMIYYLISRFDLSVKMDDFDTSRATLERMKKHRRFFNSSNYKFMKCVLDNLMSGSPLYLYDRDYSENDVMFWQMKVLASLESAEIETANLYWDKLKGMSPQSYQESFMYKGDKCLFSLALNKHFKRNVTKIEVPSGLSKMDHLISILNSSISPVRKELLYEMVWGETLESKSDLNKLTKMVCLLQKKYGLEIKSIKGSYLLVGHSKKAKAV